jgi:hypothetical protein
MFFGLIKGKENLVAVQRQVTKNGKTFMQTFYVKPGTQKSKIDKAKKLFVEVVSADYGPIIAGEWVKNHTVKEEYLEYFQRAARSSYSTEKNVMKLAAFRDVDLGVADTYLGGLHRMHYHIKNGSKLIGSDISFPMFFRYYGVDLDVNLDGFYGKTDIDRLVYKISKTGVEPGDVFYEMLKRRISPTNEEAVMGITEELMKTTLVPVEDDYGVSWDFGSLQSMGRWVMNEDHNVGYTRAAFIQEDFNRKAGKPIGKEIDEFFKESDLRFLESSDSTFDELMNKAIETKNTFEERASYVRSFEVVDVTFSTEDNPGVDGKRLFRGTRGERWLDVGVGDKIPMGVASFSKSGLKAKDFAKKAVLVLDIGDGVKCVDIDSLISAGRQQNVGAVGKSGISTHAEEREVLVRVPTFTVTRITEVEKSNGLPLKVIHGIVDDKDLIKSFMSIMYDELQEDLSRPIHQAEGYDYPPEGDLEKAGKAGMIPVKKQVVKNGKVFMQTFWVKPDKTPDPPKTPGDKLFEAVVEAVSKESKPTMPEYFSIARKDDTLKIVGMPKSLVKLNFEHFGEKFFVGPAWHNERWDTGQYKVYHKGVGLTIPLEGYLSGEGVENLPGNNDIGETARAAAVATLNIHGEEKTKSLIESAKGRLGDYSIYGQADESKNYALEKLEKEKQAEEEKRRAEEKALEDRAARIELLGDALDDTVQETLEYFGLEDEEGFADLLRSFFLDREPEDEDDLDNIASDIQDNLQDVGFHIFMVGMTYEAPDVTLADAGSIQSDFLDINRFLTEDGNDPLTVEEFLTWWDYMGQKEIWEGDIVRFEDMDDSGELTAGRIVKHMVENDLSPDQAFEWAQGVISEREDYKDWNSPWGVAWTNDELRGLGQWVDGNHTQMRQWLKRKDFIDGGGDPTEASMKFQTGDYLPFIDNFQSWSFDDVCEDNIYRTYDSDPSAEPMYGLFRGTRNPDWKNLNVGESIQLGAGSFSKSLSAAGQFTDNNNVNTILVLSERFNDVVSAVDVDGMIAEMDESGDSRLASATGVNQYPGEHEVIVRSPKLQIADKYVDFTGTTFLHVKMIDMDGTEFIKAKFYPDRQALIDAVEAEFDLPLHRDPKEPEGEVRETDNLFES